MIQIETDSPCDLERIFLESAHWGSGRVLACQVCLTVSTVAFCTVHVLRLC